MQGRDSQGVWDGHVHSAVFKMHNYQGPSYSTWNSVQCYAAARMGGISGENGYVYF